MARRVFTPEQIINKLREAEVLLSQGDTVGEASRKIGVTEQRGSVKKQRGAKTGCQAQGCGWPDACWGHSPIGNNKHVYACHKVPSMLFVAKAVLR